MSARRRRRERYQSFLTAWRLDRQAYSSGRDKEGLRKNAVAVLEPLIGAAGAELITPDPEISHVGAVSAPYDRLPAQPVMTGEVQFMISGRAEY